MTSHVHCHPPFAQPQLSPRALRHLGRLAREGFVEMHGGPGKGQRHGYGRGYGVPGFGGPGFGGPGFGGPGFGGQYGRRGRRARRGDVRIALLMLLAEESRNGYGLMQEIEQRSDGRWRPSPGSVYPALSQLEDEGLVRSEDAPGATGRLFRLTDAGRAEVDARESTKPAPWDTPAGDEDDPLHELRALVGQVAGATIQVAQAGDANQVTRARDLLVETRRALYRILADDKRDA